MSRLPLRDISIDQLRNGMYVVRLDISWIDSPFLTHFRKIKSDKDIALLKKAGVKTLVIDPNRGEDVDEPMLGVDSASSQADEASQTLRPEQVLDNEITYALEIRNQVKHAVLKLHHDISIGSSIRTEDITPLIDETLDSLDRHSAALLSLAHVSHRSQKLADHTFSTFCIALNLANARNATQDELEALGIAALLHEVGWSQIPIQLMGKRTHYTAPEIALIEKHTEIAVAALSGSDIPELSLRIIAEHHELCDGTGYPNKLKKAQIHPMSRLFSVVDRYDELVHQLCDKPGMLPANALRALYVTSKENRYDAEVVANLISMLGVYPISSAVKLSNGMEGIIRQVPPSNHLMPLIEVRIDSKGNFLDTPIYLDLTSEEAVKKSITIKTLIDPLRSLDSNHKRLILDL